MKVFYCLRVDNVISSCSYQHSLSFDSIFKISVVNYSTNVSLSSHAIAMLNYHILLQNKRQRHWLPLSVNFYAYDQINVPKFLSSKRTEIVFLSVLVTRLPRH